MDLLKTLLVYMTMVYASSVQSMPDAEAYMATVVTPTPAVTATAEPTPRPTAVPTVEVSVNPDYHTIQTGDKGDEVLRLQQALAEYGYYEGDLDGRFGQQTRRAVERFQYSHGLTADGFYACVSDPEVVRYEPYRPMSREEAGQTLASRLDNGEFWAMERKTDGVYIGNLYLGRREFQSLELGYVLAREHWGRGYAREGCQALIGVAFRQGTHRIYAECDPRNEASWRLLERLGMAREAHLRQNVYFWTDEQGFPQWKDTYVYALLNPKSGTFR